MAGLLDTRLAREEASIFDDLYAAARQQEAALAEQGRRSVLGGLFSKEPVQGIDTVRFEGMPGLLSMLTPAAKAVDAPISAYRGLIPEQDMLGEALGTAGMAMGGAGVAAAPAGSLRSFAGRNAKTADLDALKVAQELSARKRDPEDIFRQTGWFKGKDGQWRFEIDDSQAEFIGNSQTTGLLGDVMRHDALYAAYPELQDISVRTGVRGSQEGAYQPPQFLGLTTSLRDPDPFIYGDEKIHAFGPTKPAILNTLLHEAGGHALQRREGFAPGSSRGTATDQLLLEQDAVLDNLERKMDARQAELGLSGYRPATNDLELKRLREQYDANVGRALDEDAIYERYYTEAGEVDARNIQLRQDMTPAERRALSPMATEDVPRSEQRLSGDVVNANASKSAGLLAASLPDSLLGTPASTVKNMLRVYHGGPNKITDPEMRSDPEGAPLGFSVTPYRGVAEVYSKGKGEISSFDIDPQNANIITEMQLYDLIDSLERRLNLDEGDASESQISTALRDAGVDAVQYPDPEMGIRVVNPNILVATKEAKQ